MSGLTRFVIPSAREVSRPMIPLGASVIGFSFSSLLCGAWSVAMRSMVPSASPRIIAWRSCSVRSGQVHFAECRVQGRHLLSG